MNKKIIILDNSNLAYSGDEINGVTLKIQHNYIIFTAFSIHYSNNYWFVPRKKKTLRRRGVKGFINP